MPERASRHLLALDVPPGAEGVLHVHRALREAIMGTGPAVALLPTDDGSTHVQAQRAALAVDAPLEADGIAALVTTSGSSGDPMGVLLSAAALGAAAHASHSVLARGPGRWLVAMPVTAVGGLMTVARAIDAGTDPVPWPGVGGAQSFTPTSFTHTARRVLELSAADGAPAYVSLVPTQLARVLDDSAATDTLARFDHVLIGAAALPTSLRQAALASGVQLTSTYGASETCGGVVYDGRPLPGVEVTIGDGDHVCIGGATLASGYRGRPDLTEAAFHDGAFHTSDIGVLNNGILTVLGRRDDVIKVGGRKVSLVAVVDAVRSVEGVLDAAALAMDDPEWGQIPVIVAVRTGPNLPDDAAVHDAISDAAGSTRARIRWVDSLPYLPNGKIDRMQLRARLEMPL
ncbi:MAG: AMP-binding protein [Actinobacteria bacterium]|nr:AMP-binding protein [Actinomycetota bacterium]